MNNNDNKVEFQNEVTNEEKTWGMLVHLSALIQLVFHFFGLILGPLIIWLIKKDTMPFVKDQGREALNFNMSVALYGVILAIGAGIMPFSLPGFAFFHLSQMDFSGTWPGIFSSMYTLFLSVIFFALLLFWIINTIRGAMTANKGIKFRYPLTIHFLSEKKNDKI